MLILFVLSCKWNAVKPGAWSASPTSGAQQFQDLSIILSVVPQVLHSEHAVRALTVRAVSRQLEARSEACFSISPSNEYSWLISFIIDWFDLLAVQNSQESSPTPQLAQEPWDPIISRLGVDLKNTKMLKDTCIPTIMAIVDTIAKTRKQPKCRRTDE